MKKKIIYLSVAVLLIITLAFVRTLFIGFTYTSAKNIEVKDGLFCDSGGAAFSGEVVLETADMNNFVKQAIALFPIASVLQSMGKGGYNSSEEELEAAYIAMDMEKRLKGFVVYTNIENGKMTGETGIYYDIRKGKNEMLSREISKGMKYWGAYAFNNQIKLAAISFKDGALDGESYLLNPTSSTKNAKVLSADFKNNSLTQLKRYHENGQLKRVNNFVDFRKEGLQQEYHSDGELTWEGELSNNKRKWEKSYYRYPHALREENKYNDSAWISSTSYYPNGKKATERTDSLQKEWFSNGDIKLTKIGYNITYGTAKGLIETYHKNGRIATSYNYDNSGVKNGAYSIYYKNGELWEQGTMKDGLQQGKLQKWYKNKQLAEDHQMVNGKIEGKYIRYYDNGQKHKEFFYKNGKLEGAYKKWWKDNTVAEDHQMVNDKIEGKYLRYYEDGQKHKFFFYKNGKLEGTCQTWYSNGKLSSKCEYPTDNFAPKCEKWDEEGKLIE